MNTRLIELSDSEIDDCHESNYDNKSNCENDNDNDTNKSTSENYIKNNKNKFTQIVNPSNDILNNNSSMVDSDITLVKKDNIEHKNPNVTRFVKFCISIRLFDDTFYDYGNAFSIMATKLHTTFDLFSLDGKIIKKELFIELFKNEFNYDGDILDIFNEMTKNNKYITWGDFIEFFIPFVKHVTV
jgi:hypothetical protein